MNDSTQSEMRRRAAFQPDAHDEAHEGVKTLAHHLYILAWTIEGIAVALGLGMALAQGGSSAADFLLGGGGFVMVACAELSKIPLATFLVRSSSRRSRVVTLAFLLLMSFITFETIFFSLERGFNARTLSVRIQAEEIALLKSEHAKLSDFAENPSDRFRAERLAIEKQRDEIRSTYNIETGTITTNRDALRKEQHKSDIPKEIDVQLKSNEARRRSLLEEQDKKISSIDAPCLPALERP